MLGFLKRGNESLQSQSERVWERKYWNNKKYVGYGFLD